MREIESGANVSSIVLSLQDFFGISKDIWFRGQPTYSHELTPSIFRQGDKFGCQFDEAMMYKEFIRRYPEKSSSHKNVYDWLTLMQHYGLPTRLLDWTTNLIVALYFCCNKDNNEDAALFAFDPEGLWNYQFTPLMEMQILSNGIDDFYRRLIFDMKEVLDDETRINGISIGDIKKDPSILIKFTHVLVANENTFNSVEIKQPLPPNTVYVDGEHKPYILPHVYSNIIRHFSNIITFKSNHLNQRIKQQHGCFTFHGGKYFEGKEFVKFEKMEEHPDLGDKLVKVRIKSSDKVKLLKELNLLGIREATLFPEMEYQAKEIKEKYKFMQQGANMGWNVCISKDEFDKIKSNESFIYILILARFLNVLRFLQLSSFLPLQQGAPSATRQRINAPLFVGSVLYECYLFSNSLGKHFGKMDVYQNGFGVILKDKKVEILIKKLNVMRNQLVFHFDTKHIEELRTSLSTFEPNFGDDVYRFALGSGQVPGEVYCALADEFFINYLLCQDGPKDNEILKTSIIDLYEDMKKLMECLTNAADALITEVLSQQGWTISE